MTQFKRKSLIFLKKWANSVKPKPLILRGARQVGKSTLVEMFAQTYGYQLHKINLETIRLSLTDVPNSQKLLTEVEAISNLPITKKSIIFFDEIQKQPAVFPALRYLYESHPGLLVIAAGSLLEFYIEELTTDIPVGRLQYIHLGPITFFEFLNATSQKLLLRHLLDYSNGVSEMIHERYHKNALEQFAVYLRLGGMPEAVKSYCQTKSFLNCDEVHQSILQTYADDFYKYSTKSQLEKLDILFRKLPGVVGEKIKWHEMDPNSKSRDLIRAFDLLCKAQVIHRCIHSNASGLTIESTADQSVFKSFFIDVGLLMSSLHFEKMPLDLEIDNYTKGKIYEQYIAQTLAFARGPIFQPTLHYWLRDKNVHKAEIDFLIE